MSLGPPPITVEITSCCPSAGKASSMAISTIIKIREWRISPPGSFAEVRFRVSVSAITGSSPSIRLFRQALPVAHLHKTLPPLPLGIAVHDEQSGLGAVLPALEFALGNGELLREANFAKVLP